SSLCLPPASVFLNRPPPPPRHELSLSPWEAPGSGTGVPSAGHASSDDSNVLGFLALAARGDVELDALALLQRAVALALNRREVDEDVVRAFTLDEAVTLLGIEKLHCALRCHSDSLTSCDPAGVSTRQPGHLALSNSSGVMRN